MIAAPTTDGLFRGVPETVYHADRGSLSSSGARKLLAPSCPALFQHAQDHPEHSAAFDLGSVTHRLVLGAGAEIVVVDADDWRSKTAREERDEAHASGASPVLRKEFEQARAMSRAVGEHPVAAALLSSGEPELSGYWQDQETGVRCRFRPDWLTSADGRVVCVDLKTSTTAHPGTFARKAADFGYHQQAAWYREGLIELGLSNDPRFLFIVQSKSAPFPVSVVEFDPEAIAIGNQANREARRAYAECAETGIWPGYSQQITTITLPSYIRGQQEDHAA